MTRTSLLGRSKQSTEQPAGPFSAPTSASHCLCLCIQSPKVADPVPVPQPVKEHGVADAVGDKSAHRVPLESGALSCTGRAVST
eukprot:952246-Amphidinium_carterae.1